MRLFIIALSVVLVSCSNNADTPVKMNEGGSTEPAIIETLSPTISTAEDDKDKTVIANGSNWELIETLPHDPSAFTQGLEFKDDMLFESRGLYEQSAITQIDPSTSVLVASTVNNPNEFAEGLTIVGDEIVQLTWQEGIAHRWTLGLEPIGDYTYDGEGWGLCHDGSRFIMSNGSSSLTFRDNNFDPIDTVKVTRDGVAIDMLNELECVNGSVYANVWQTPEIVKINPETGVVEETYDFSEFVPEDATENMTLNGIAYNQEEDYFLITGKLWNRMYKVNLF